MSANSKVVSLNNRHNLTGQVKARKLLDTCRGHTLKFMKALLQRMLDNADDALFAMADKAENNAEQTQFFDSMRIVRLHRREIENRFYDVLAEGFDNFWDRAADDADSPLNADLTLDDLSLVEETDLEESLAIKNLIGKLKNNFGPQIGAIEHRLNEIASHIEVNEKNNPMSPYAICMAFNEATQDLDTDISIKLIIYKLFDKQLVTDIPPLYDTLNQEFIRAGVLPKIKARIQRPPTYQAPPAPGEMAEEPGMVEQPPIYTEAEMVSDPGAFMSNLHQLLAASRPAGQTGSGLTGRGQGGMMYGGGQATGLPPMPTQDVLAALTALQQQGTDSYPAEGGAFVMSDGIRSAMGNQLGMKEGQPVPLNNMDNDMIDVIAMMFEFILDDPNLPDIARALIGRLQIPMLKVAILDKEFFSSKSHPARKLLNELSATGIGLDENADSENALVQTMESIVNRVIEDFNDDMGLFDVLLDELEAFRELYEAQEEEKQQTARQQIEVREQSELAKSWVRETLKEALGDTTLPKEVLKIIMGPWHAVMTHTYINEGEHSANWKNQLRFIDVLVWSIQPKQDNVDRKRLGKIIRDLTASLRDGLKNIDYPEEKIEHLFNALEPYHHASLHGLGVAAGEIPESRDKAKDDVMASGLRQSNPEASFFLFEGSDEPPEEFIGEESVDQGSMSADQLAVAASIDEMEAQMATLTELEAMLDEPLSSLTEGEREEEEALSEFDKEILEDIVLAGWESEDHLDDQPDDEYLELARHLEAGKWVEFTDDNDNKVRAKLTWKSELLGEYTFTNWKFDVVADKTLRGFAADLRRGTARIIDDVPVLDRALSAVMNGLAKKAS